jgi:hypothetical protein
MRKRSKGDMVRYLYHEMDSLESRMFEKTMEADPTLAEECRELRETKVMLDGLVTRPRHQVLKNILAYAEETRHQPATQP